MQLRPATARLVLVLAWIATMASPSLAQPSTSSSSKQAASSPQCVDRVVVRFDVPELGGPAHPRFVFARELAFEARLQALVEHHSTGRPLPSNGYDEHHLQQALERHISEEILQSLPMSPPARADEVRQRFVATYASLQQRVGGRKALLDAADAEGIEMIDIDAMIRRRALASLYIDRMISPMLDPSDIELRQVLRERSTPFRGKPFARVAAQLRRWYVSMQAQQALASFFRSARARIHIVVFPGGC